MPTNTTIPKFVSVVAILLGCLDIIRGFIHTILLDFAATNIAGLDLTTSLAGDLLQQIGVFGISNTLTGIMLILIGWKARQLALIMLGVIPAVYTIGFVAIKINSAPYAPSQATWGGAKPMLVYLIISAVAFIAGGWVTMYRKKAGSLVQA